MCENDGFTGPTPAAKFTIFKNLCLNSQFVWIIYMAKIFKVLQKNRTTKVNWWSHSGKLWMFLKKLKTKLPCDPAIPLLGKCPKKPKTLIRKDTCIQMFIAALFIVARTWKLSKYQSTDEWLKKIYNGIICSHKKNGILLLAPAWKDWRALR